MEGYEMLQSFAEHSTQQIVESLDILFAAFYWMPQTVR
jgi:hypothetical protein